MATTILAEPESYPLPSKHEYLEYSEAPLENVRRARVYYRNASDEDDHHPPGSTVGLLLFYRNGGQRALGDCRIGLDPFVTFDGPARIWFAHMNQEGGRRGVKIWFEEARPAEENQEECDPQG
jgi:hypothetical protein